MEIIKTIYRFHLSVGLTQKKPAASGSYNMENEKAIPLDLFDRRT